MAQKTGPLLYFQITSTTTDQCRVCDVSFDFVSQFDKEINDLLSISMQRSAFVSFSNRLILIYIVCWVNLLLSGLWWWWWWWWWCRRVECHRGQIANSTNRHPAVHYSVTRWRHSRRTLRHHCPVASWRHEWWSRDHLWRHQPAGAIWWHYAVECCSADDDCQQWSGNTD